MQLYCQTCGRPVPAEDINIKLAIAKCGGCNAVFSFLEKLGGPSAVKPTVQRPQRFEVENWGPELIIRRSWYSHGLWALVAFCTFWDGFLAVWYTIAVRGLVSGSMGGEVWIMLLLPVLHLGVGIGLTYFVISSFFNRTTIRVTPFELTVRSGPLPWPGNCQVLTAELKQLYCTENRCSQKDDRSFRYDVMALKRDNTPIKLVGGLAELDHALFIEQQVERHLKIRDERVAGEVCV